MATCRKCKGRSSLLLESKNYSADQKDIRWSESSFMYQSNKQSEGWNQSHFQQYQKQPIPNN